MVRTSEHHVIHRTAHRGRWPVAGGCTRTELYVICNVSPCSAAWRGVAYCGSCLGRHSQQPAYLRLHPHGLLIKIPKSLFIGRSCDCLLVLSPQSPSEQGQRGSSSGSGW